MFSFVYIINEVFDALEDFLESIMGCTVNLGFRLLVHFMLKDFTRSFLNQKYLI